MIVSTMDLARLFSDSEKLEGSSNYQSWSFRVKTLLRKDELWEDLTHTPSPDVFLPERQCELACRKIRAISIIQATVKDSIIPTVCRFEDDPHHLWLHLQQRFESRVVQRKLILIKKLSSVRMAPSGTIEEYCKQIDNIVGQLANINHTIPEEELMYTVFNGLPFDWELFVSNFSTDLSKMPPPNYANPMECL